MQVKATRWWTVEPEETSAEIGQSIDLEIAHLHQNVTKSLIEVLLDASQ
jgi:hypothetical protein